MAIKNIGHRIRLRTRLDAIMALLCNESLKPDNLIMSDVYLMAALSEAQRQLNETIELFKEDLEKERQHNETI